VGTINTGLAITVMLANVHALLVGRRKVKWDWLAVLGLDHLNERLFG
jgi:hypothetical protein